MSHEISPISTAVNVRVLTMGPKVSGFLLGFNLDDEVNVIPNRTQKSIHAKVGTFESAAGFFPDFVFNHIERNRLRRQREDEPPYGSTLMQLLPFSGQALLMTPACRATRSPPSDRACRMPRAAPRTSPAAGARLLAPARNTLKQVDVESLSSTQRQVLKKSCVIGAAVIPRGFSNPNAGAEASRRTDTKGVGRFGNGRTPFSTRGAG